MLPIQAFINDVGPRDGLQSQSVILSVPERRELISLIISTGIKHIEVGSFVSATAVPAMAGTDQVIAPFLVDTQYPQNQFSFSVLIPNVRGFQAAKTAHVKNINFVICSTDTMNQKNVRKNTDELVAELQQVCSLAAEDSITINAYISTAWDCPFEGVVSAQKIVSLAEQLLKAGVSKIILSDSIGSADPKRVRQLVSEVKTLTAVHNIGCHFHDTRSLALANVFASLEEGVTWFDSSIGGLGGCPFAPGASGNLATEDLVLLLEQQGIHTGVNALALIQAIDTIQAKFAVKCNGGKTFQWQKSKLLKQ
ncbi:MAG: hydroxymethylglutaryl-CoA lyase [Methylacidiphilales bacterium]|nr:hydroxymethylglutaryl-CoA lyase [Candidatus Methylacidiphilales bacterium]